MYKIKINTHGVILTQYGSAEDNPTHGSTDSDGFTWLESVYPIDGQSQYWNGSAWISCPSKPNAWSIWESGSWVDSSRLKEQIQGSVLNQLKMHRNDILSGTDWTQGSDCPLTDSKKAEWATYRQTLRDFPATNDPAATDFNDLVWPTPP